VQISKKHEKKSGGAIHAESKAHPMIFLYCPYDSWKTTNGFSHR
jgi:hypothetical protein